MSLSHRHAMALPTNIAAELRVLGALIEDDGLVHDIGLSVDDFVLSDHRRIFWAIVALHARDCPVDLFTAIEELGNSQEDYVVVASLVHGVVLHEDHTHNHAAIIRKKTRLRSLLKIAEWITESV